MNRIIGIRHEDKYAVERRAPLTPRHVAKLVRRHDVRIVVQSSSNRIFTNEEYRKAGAKVCDTLSDIPVIMGVKEIPPDTFERNKTYIFFSHVIKGQPYNMPMLRKMMELGCSLIDYETITDERGNRLVAFGGFAGLAGMINTLWSLGQRLKAQGITDNPFLIVKQSHKYDSLDEAKRAVSGLGRAIYGKGLPRRILPFTIGITGYGNVSAGAQEILDLLPVKEISPGELLEIRRHNDLPTDIIYKVIFKEEHIVKPLDPSHPFDRDDYFNHPEKYESNFEQYIPHLTVLMNCMYWDHRYPRIFTKEYARKLFEQSEPKLKVIGDITCDPEGSIEFTHKGTAIDDPVFVYNPHTGLPAMGFQGEGIAVMAVDILPSELPRESSEAFGDALLPFIKPIANANFNVEFDNLNQPPEIKRALILHKGLLTPRYEYIKQYL